MRRVWASSLLVGLLLLAVPSAAHADVNNFTVTDFTADETLTRADKQGELHIVEHISVNFTDYNHGITRAIPKSYKHHSLKLHINSVSSTSGAPSQYSTSSSSGNTVLKIGNPHRTITGAQEYTIDYTVRNVVTFYGDHDELYWDVNGDQWDQPFTHVAVTLQVPQDAYAADPTPRCMTGAYGATSSDCTITVANGTVTASADYLGRRRTLTYVVAFQKGYFAPATFIENVADYIEPVLEFAVPILAAALAGLIWWLRSGRDAKGRGTIIPEYAPPEGMTPLEAGAIADFKVDNRDITATIIDLARRGYACITESRTGKMSRNKVTYTLELKNADWSGCNPYEVQVLGALFQPAAVGRSVDIGKSGTRLYKTAEVLRTTVSTNLTQQGYLRRNPYKFVTYGSSAALIVFCIFYGFSREIFTSNLWPLIIGIVIGCLVLIPFVRAIPARTAKGVAVKDHLLGLKLYMETAEKDRMEKMEGPEAAYAASAGEPERTVELFEKLLPYAIVLRVEKQWAGKFEDIYTSPPDWYNGNWAAFSVGYMAGSLNAGFGAAINTSFSSPSSSGSSGFGSGFAGGGGGGGGGGGW